MNDRLHPLLSLLLVVPLLAACGSDDGEGGEPSGTAATEPGTSGADATNSEAPQEPSGDPESTGECSDLPRAANVGAPCAGEGPAFCGDGGVCAGEREDGVLVSRCRQICTIPRCSDACEEGLQCEAVLDENNEPTRFGGEDVGACFTPRVGGQGAFDACGGEHGDCAEHHACTAITFNAERATCFPMCTGLDDESCPTVEGFVSYCGVRLQGVDSAACIIDCTTGEHDTCPAGMSCVDFGGSGLCVR
ncbi:MAG: hypothetical protein EA398_17215 [Deltaproteobacteria bacterium]|nr:MAG: hypothetical protein EA398_17215 [Deltaproteobacteria bacterium]